MTRKKYNACCTRCLPWLHSMHFGCLGSLLGMHIQAAVPDCIVLPSTLKVFLHCLRRSTAYAYRACFNSWAKLLLAFGCGAFSMGVLLSWLTGWEFSTGSFTVPLIFAELLFPLLNVLLRSIFINCLNLSLACYCRLPTCSMLPNELAAKKSIWKALWKQKE